MLDSLASLLLDRGLLTEPRLLGPPDDWVEHIPFAAMLVRWHAPRRFVELGVRTGISYCLVCQVLAEHGHPCECSAIDTWEGDAHGSYGPEVLENLRAHHDPLYGSFSQLIPETFDDARAAFADGSIDLLHIDGCHGYDAVKHDFENWVGALSDRGIVLVHDIAARRTGFGVSKFWREVSERYPSFAMQHCNGLGCLFVGKDSVGPFAPLLEAGAAEQQLVRDLVRLLGGRLVSRPGDPLGAQAASRVGAMAAGRTRLRDLVRQLSEVRDGDLEAGAANQAYATIAGEYAAALARASESEDGIDLFHRELESIVLEALAGLLVAGSSVCDRARLEHELEHANARIAAMRGSVSWRLTAPVRFVVDLLSRPFR